MRNTFLNRAERQRGSVTVEAVVGFTGFLLVIFTILCTINLCRAQMLISSAVDTAARELAQYSYFYEMSGLQKFDKTLSEQASVGKDNVNEVIGAVDGLYGAISGATDHTVQNATNIANGLSTGEVDLDKIQTAVDDAEADADKISGSIDQVSGVLEQVGDNPVLYMKSLVAIAGEEGMTLAKRAIAASLAKMFVSKHFESDSESADAALERLGVVDGLEGMNFKLSTMFTDGEHEDIQLVVVYKIKLIQFFDMEALEATISKQAVCRAWLGGDNVQTKVDPDQKTDGSAGGDGSGDDGSGGSNGEVPDGDTNNNETPEQTPEGEPDEKEEKPPVDTTGSLWVMEDDQRQFWFSSYLTNGLGLSRDGYTSALYGRDADGVAYGMTYAVNAKDAAAVYYMAYVMSMETLAQYEANYTGSDGANGYEPGTTTGYVHVVYVPENISDEELDAIRTEIAEDAERYQEDGSKYGYDIPISIQIVRAGGNYDYGSEESE